MPGTLLWCPEADDGAFDTMSLMDATCFKRLLRGVASDGAAAGYDSKLDKLDLLARDLSEAARRTSFSRWHLFKSAGRVVAERKRHLADVLREHLGDKVEWQVVGANTGEFERGGARARVAALLALITPVVWVRFTF